MSKYTKTMRDALAEMSEAFSKKQIKMAIGIASDPRYKQGNYSGAVKQIEKLKKGLSDHPQVAAVLKRQNEEILEKVKCPDCEGEGCPKCEVKEAKFSDDMINKLKKAYEPMKGKKINPTPLMKIFDKIDSNKDGLEQLYKADIPFVSMMAMSRLMLKHNYKAADINKLGKIRREDFVEEVELDEGKAYKFAAVDKKGLVIGFASDEKDAKDMARRNKGRVVTLTKPLPDKKGDMMINRPLPDKMDKFPTNTSATQGKRMEETELDEGKMKAVAMKIDSIVAKMKKNKEMKSFADKFKKDAMKTMDIAKSLEKVLPDYIAGKDISALVKEETVVESWELDEMKMDDPKLLKIFDKLKKGSTVKIKIDSSISKGKDYREFTVTAKNIVGKGKRFEQEKITLKSKDNPTGVKHFLYNRDGKVTLAIGDMGASIADIKENNMSAYTAAITKGVK